MWNYSFINEIRPVITTNRLTENWTSYLNPFFPNNTIEKWTQT